jgi:hypothetical protein
MMKQTLVVASMMVVDDILVEDVVVRILFILDLFLASWVIMMILHGTIIKIGPTDANVRSVHFIRNNL